MGGTEGYYGFFYKNKYYLKYNPYDSYFAALGNNIIIDIISLLDEYGYDKICQMVENMIIYDPSIEPSSTDIEKLKPYTRLDKNDIGSRDKDWYLLTRKIDGPKDFLTCGYYSSQAEQECNKYSFDYKYIIDLDKKKLVMTEMNVKDVVHDFSENTSNIQNFKKIRYKYNDIQEIDTEKICLVDEINQMFRSIKDY